MNIRKESFNIAVAVLIMDMEMPNVCYAGIRMVNDETIVIVHSLPNDFVAIDKHERLKQVIETIKLLPSPMILSEDVELSLDRPLYNFGPITNKQSGEHQCFKKIPTAKARAPDRSVLFLFF